MPFPESKYAYSKRKRIPKVNDPKRENKNSDIMKDAFSNGSDISTDKVPTEKCKYGGDPVNVVTGSFYIEATDLLIEDRGIDLCIKRRYNSLEENVGVMGKGWTFEYDSHLNIDNDNITLIYPDGHKKEFKKTGSIWKNQNDESEAEILEEDIATGGYILKSKDLSYRYDNKGKLMSIIDRNGNTVQLSYNNRGEINSIVSPGGKILSFSYANDKICKITDNIGRQVIYKYNGDFLVEVTYPNDGTVKYTYENGLITKVTDQNGVTYVTNEYDEKGRVVKQYDSESNETFIEYDDEKRENTFTYLSTGVVSRYRYNDICLVTEEIYKDGTGEKYTYDQYSTGTAKPTGTAIR